MINMQEARVLKFIDNLSRATTKGAAWSLTALDGLQLKVAGHWVSIDEKEEGGSRLVIGKRGIHLTDKAQEALEVLIQRIRCTNEHMIDMHQRFDEIEIALVS